MHCTCPCTGIPVNCIHQLINGQAAKSSSNRAKLSSPKILSLPSNGRRLSGKKK
jgi:hypothetical protein